jgi:hypothetical protein
MTPIIDDAPYIIVDNRKISPIERLPRSPSMTDDRPTQEEQTFGVVDRVTISGEAREKARHQPADATTLETLLKAPSKNSPLLTY